MVAVVKFILFVTPLGLDTLAVAVALGLMNARPLRPALTFALFEAAMPLIGLAAGRFLERRFDIWAGVLGGLVLIGVAFYIARESLEGDDEAQGLSFATLRSSVLAGVAISVDELAIGLPMGTSGLPIAGTMIAIGAQAFAATWIGIAVGRRLSRAGGRRLSRAAGLVAAVAFGGLGGYLIAQNFIPGLPTI